MDNDSDFQCTEIRKEINSQDHEKASGLTAASPQQGVAIKIEDATKQSDKLNQVQELKVPVNPSNFLQVAQQTQDDEVAEFRAKDMISEMQAESINVKQDQSVQPFPDTRLTSTQNDE